MRFSLKQKIVAALVLLNSFVWAQDKKDSLGLPGDNFDLYGALELFKTSANPEAFEKAINSSNNEVNNLDLDANGKVDYVHVIDKTKDDSHSLVLQVAVSKSESQDVAVIEIEKLGVENAHLQIIGDEALYGKDYIVEPKNIDSKSEASDSKYRLDQSEEDVYKTTGAKEAGSKKADNETYSNNTPPMVINIWAWPSVQFMYGNAYLGWASPYYYGYYPGWWQPWQPIYYPVYYRRMYRYHQDYFYRTSYYRCNNAHNYYYGQRSASPIVRERNRSGYYRARQAENSNTGAPGRRYNNLPANNGRGANESKSRAKENNERAAPQNSNRSVEQQNQNRSTEKKNKEGTFQSKEIKKEQQTRGQEVKPIQAAPRSEQIKTRQQQTNPQPKAQPNVQPRQIKGGGSQAAPRGNVGRQK